MCMVACTQDAEEQRVGKSANKGTYESVPPGQWCLV